MTSTASALGERIRDALGDMTQHGLAKALGVKPPQISRLLTRETYAERALAMRRVAVALEVEPGAYLRVLQEHSAGHEAELARQLIDIAEALRVDVERLLPE